MLYIVSTTPVFTINSLKKSWLKTVNLHRVGKCFTISVCWSWWKKDCRTFPQNISTEKAQKYPFPWKHTQFKVISYIRSNKSTPINQSKYIATAEFYLLNAHKIPKKGATERFWALPIPDSFNLYLVLYCMFCKFTIMNT